MKRSYSAFFCRWFLLLILPGIGLAQTGPTFKPNPKTSITPSATKPKATVTITDANSSNADDEDAPRVIQPRQGVTIYDLSKAIQQAMKISPAVDSARYDLEYSEAQYQEASNARFVPQIDMRVFGGVVPNVPNGSGPEGGFPSVDVNWYHLGPFMQMRIETFQPLYTFGKLRELRHAALLGVDAKTEGVNKAKNDLVYQIKRAYIGLTSLYSFKEFIMELQDRSAQARSAIDKDMKKKSSQVTDIDLMRIEVFEAETSRRLIEINNGIDFTLMTLKVLMGLPRNSQIDIADQKLRMDDTVVLPIDEYIKMAKDNRPEITQLHDLVQIRQAVKKGVKASFYPTFGIIGFYRFGLAPDREESDNPFLVDDYHYNSGGAFLAMNQNLSFHMTHAKLKEEEAQYEKALADEQRALQGIEIEIRKAQSNAMAKQQAVEVAKRGFKSGRSWVLASTLNFGIGVGPPKDLLEAFVGYSTVKSNYLQTLSDYQLALADLSNAIGKEVTKLTY